MHKNIWRTAKCLYKGGGSLESKGQIKLNEKEAKLIKLIRATEFGELKIIIQNSLPIRVEEMKKSIKL